VPPELVVVPRPWSKWAHPKGAEYTIGIEEEVMLLDPRTWSLAPAIDEVLAAWPEATRDSASSETHSCAVELRTGVHSSVGDAIAELGSLRAQLTSVLAARGLGSLVENLATDFGREVVRSGL